jgi:spore coat protein U-like protein
MSNGVDPPAFVLYALFQDPSYTTEWGDLGFGNTYPSGSSLADTGTGIAQPHTVYGWLELGLQGQPLGAYTDTVLVTVNY